MSGGHTPSMTNEAAVQNTVWCTDGPETLYDRVSVAIASAEGAQP
jgi:hypothetical protein